LLSFSLALFRFLNLSLALENPDEVDDECWFPEIPLALMLAMILMNLGSHKQ